MPAQLLQHAGDNPGPKVGRGASWSLARQIQKQIESGLLAPGARLPSYRELIEEHDLTLGSVTYAMTILSAQGYVERRRGSGVYVRATSSGQSGSGRDTGLFALVVPEIESGLYVSLQAGMESAAQQERMQLITMTTGGDAMRQADALLQLVDRDVAGIALVPSYHETHAHQLRHLGRTQVPLVLLHRGVPGVKSPLIDIPFAEVGRLAGEAIGSRGHRHVGAFVGMQSSAADQYLEGFRHGLRKHGVICDDRWIIRSDTLLTEPAELHRYSEEVDRAIADMASRPDRPTAVFATFDRFAEMVYLAAVRNGLRVPQDLSIICFGEKRRTGALLPRLASVCVDEHETGREAYRLLSAMRSRKLPMEYNDRFTMGLTFDPAETIATV
jgi:GntR family transcriptional regulator of arabinose operon